MFYTWSDGYLECTAGVSVEVDTIVGLKRVVERYMDTQGMAAYGHIQ